MAHHKIPLEHEPLLDLLDRQYQYLQLSVMVDTLNSIPPYDYKYLVPYKPKIIQFRKGYELSELYTAIERRYLQQGYKLDRIVNRFAGDCQVIQFNLQKIQYSKNKEAL